MPLEGLKSYKPGHGRASGDTHKQTSRTPALASLKEVDLPPFGKALSQVPAPVMLGHLVVPEWGDLPATLNPAAYNLLRSGDYPEGSPYDGVMLRDPSFWNTRVYRSKNFHLKNIKIFNNHKGFIGFKAFKGHI